jgi:serine/threonine protein kinase
VAATLIHIGPSAHDNDRDAILFLAEGLPDTATVFAHPILVEPSGAIYEVSAIVALPHAIYVVEIKGWRGHLKGDARDWYLPEARRSPLLFAHKTAQVLRTLLQRRSHDAGRVWVQELVFLPAAASFHSNHDAVRKGVALRGEIHAALQDTARVRELSHRRAAEPLDAETFATLHAELCGRPAPLPLHHVAGFTIIDHFDANERYREVLGEDTTRTRRVLRVYRNPPTTREADREQLRKRATWEAGVLRSFARAPEDICFPAVDPPVDTDHGLVVPMEHFDGKTLPSWLAAEGAHLDLSARVALWARFARALAWAHRAGVVHRRLHADLILVKGEPHPREPHTPAYRITGFDLAKRQGYDTTIALSDATLARFEGAAPEVIESRTDALPASDQFSLGLILAWLVLRRPLIESTLTLIERRHRVPHLRDLDADVPQRLDDAVARMLERKPHDRFPSVEEAIDHALAAVRTDHASADISGLAPGARVGSDYVVEARVGEGGLAEVYRVKHQLLGERYALKVARPTEAAERAIRAEFFALQTVNHPCVVRAHDLTKMVEDRITLRLDYIPGVTLSAAVREGKLPPGDVAARRRLGEDLLSALDTFERIGLAHHDLKPDNLMVTSADPLSHLVVIDFSLARSPAVDAKLGPAPLLGGTYEWRDPSGEPLGPATDRYAAAMCLFWLHVGRHPFDGRAPEPDAPLDLDPSEVEPPGLAAFFAAALSPRPADRPRSAVALRDAYLQALGAPRARTGEPHEVLTADTLLSATSLLPRAARALNAARVRTVGELVGLGSEGLGRIAGLGDRLIERVQAFLAEAHAQGVQPRTRPEPDAPPFFRPCEHDPAPAAGLGLEGAVLEALHAAGLRTVGDVAGATRAELAALPNVGQRALVRLGEALVRWSERAQSGGAVDTLDAVWTRATASVDPTTLPVLEAVYGLRDAAPLPQTEVAKRFGLDPARVSTAKTAALTTLDRTALAPILDAVDGYLELEKGVAPITLICQRLARDFPTAALEPSGLLRLFVELDTHRFHLLADLGESPLPQLVRPWFSRAALTTFADTVVRVVKWPPEPAAAARTTLRMVLPEYEGDPLVLAERLVPSVCTTAGGALFQPPVPVDEAIRYVLDSTRDGLDHPGLVATTETVFAGRGPAVPPLHALPALLEGSPWRVDGVRIVRRDAAAPEATSPRGDPAHDLLGVDATVDPLDRVRDILRDASARGSSFRLIVAPAQHHADIARSVVHALRATSIDLTDAWFRRHEATLTADARAARFPALKATTAAKLDALFDALVAAHGVPGRTLVVHNTGLLGVLGGLDQVRLLYDRVQGQAKGFWVLVIPGIIRSRQPLFNDQTEVWHQPGLVLPLAEPLRPLSP